MDTIVAIKNAPVPGLKNLHQADLFSPGNSYTGKKPKNSWEKIPETQRYLENSNCCITVDKL